MHLNRSCESNLVYIPDEIVRSMSLVGTPKLTVCPMSPVGPGVCAIPVASPSGMWLRGMDLSADRVSTWSTLQELIVMAVPNMLAFVASFAVNMITFASLSMVDDPRLLGAVGLGSLIGNIFGFAIGIGLTSVCDTLVSQAVGARNFELSVVHLNRARVISTIVALPCFCLIWLTEPLLLLTKQDADISALASLFVQGTCWGLLPYFYCNALNSFMRCHGRNLPAVAINVVTSLFHGIITYMAVNKSGMGAYGAGVCISVTYWFRWLLTELSMFMYQETRIGMRWTPRALHWSGLNSYVKLACSNSALLWIEWGAYELQALIAGWIGTKGVALACHVAGANVVTAVFMGAIGISQSAAALVGISLGKQRPNTAKSFASVSISFTFVLYCLVCLVIILGRSWIAGVISSDPLFVGTLRELLIIVAVFSIIDAVNGVGEGILRGMGMQQRAVIFKLIGMIGIRLPLGYVLSLYIGVCGIWLGAIVGMAFSLSGFIYVMSRSSFIECSRMALKLQDDEMFSGLCSPLIGNETSPRSQMQI